MGTVKERGGEGMIWGGRKVVVWMRVREEFGSRVLLRERRKVLWEKGRCMTENRGEFWI